MNRNMTFWSFDAIGMVPVSHDVNSIFSGIIAFLSLKELNEMQHDLFSQVISMAPTLSSHDATGISFEVMRPLHWCKHHVPWTASYMAPLQFLHQGDQNDMQHDFFGDVTQWNQH